MTRDLLFEQCYEAPIEDVWHALTDPAALTEWLMPNDFEARVGHEFSFRTEPRWGFDGIVRCRVTEVDPPLRLSYTWSGGGIDTTVCWELEKIRTGTRLQLAHRGFKGARGILTSFILGAGWRGKILSRRLADVLRRQTSPPER